MGLLIIKWYIKVASRAEERLRILGNREVSEKSQNLITPSAQCSPKIKILSVLVKISKKTDIELFP